MVIIAIDQLANVSGGADGACGSFVELQAPNGSKVYYDPVGIVSLSPPAVGESMKNVKTLMKTQLGSFYSADSMDDIKNKLSAICNGK